MNESSVNSSLIPVRMLTQYAYCKRLSYLEWVQGEFASNAEVVDGKYLHRNVDVPSGRERMGQEQDEKIHARSITLSDEALGLISRMDLLEIEGNVATPIEYKRGKVPDNSDRSYRDHMIQICAQGLLLRAHGYTCTSGMIYYIGSKQRVEINFDQGIVDETTDMIKEMREMSSSASIPAPLVDSPKCPRCSLVGICLPDEVNLLSEKTRQIDASQVRRMYPIRNDAIPLYVQEQGAYLSKSGERIHVKVKDKIVQKIKLIDVSDVTVFGNVQITTQAIRELCNRNIPVCYMTYGGWFTGMTTGLSHKNVELRINQYRTHGDKKASMSIAREIVFGKIRNCATLLRRNHESPPVDKIDELNGFAERARAARQYDTLLGIEGISARLYFSEFQGMIKSKSDSFNFDGRNRRPPRDPVNAVISFLYAMLTRQAAVTTSAVGLDPHLGFLHMPKYGKPALALDLIEEFRPIVADSACITLINNGEISDSDFIVTKFGVTLTSHGRRAVITAYERRMNSSITHPLLGYAASYKRIMETQARLLARHILGEIPSYPPFRTR